MGQGVLRPARSASPRWLRLILDTCSVELFNTAVVARRGHRGYRLEASRDSRPMWPARCCGWPTPGTSGFVFGDHHRRQRCGLLQRSGPPPPSLRSPGRRVRRSLRYRGGTRQRIDRAGSPDRADLETTATIPVRQTEAITVVHLVTKRSSLVDRPLVSIRRTAGSAPSTSASVGSVCILVDEAVLDLTAQRVVVAPEPGDLVGGLTDRTGQHHPSEIVGRDHPARSRWSSTKSRRPVQKWPPGSSSRMIGVGSDLPAR